MPIKGHRIRAMIGPKGRGHRETFNPKDSQAVKQKEDTMKITTKANRIILKGEAAEYHFRQEDGQLILAKIGAKEFPMEGITVDVGVEGAYARGLLGFDCLDEKRTWELPAISPLGAPDKASFHSAEEVDGRLEVAYRAGNLEIRQCYDLAGEALRVTAKVQNLSDARVTINGTAFMMNKALRGDHFDFPTNAPCDLFEGAALSENKPVFCGLVGSMMHVEEEAGHLNYLFLDTVEKWSQGAYRTAEGMTYIYIAAVECWLQPGESFLCGHAYVQPLAQGDPYEAICAFFDELGYHPATDGLREGILYSCHPHGTMDNNFQRPKDMYEYAKELPDIKALGVDHIWVLPVFEHLDRGVYHPTDQNIIDQRYGGDEAVRHFVDKAHELGMTVLFDYVPHGPAPEDPLAKEGERWCSMRRNLTMQEEWNCVSFDMTNPEYLRYTSDMVNGHVRRFEIDGARIDCAMGGLSNWRPFPGHRPSASNLAGGVAISGAIKQGFQEMGKRAFNMPENFNPVPAYYPVTDVFYGMNFYRALVALDEKRNDAKAFVEGVTRFLEIEHKAMPKELKKLRFLGNHDTVSWVWQCKRAYEVYGPARAKALFAMMAFIDGVPMVYQGDEDPSMAGKEGPIMRDFFADLYKARREYIGEGVEISYLRTGGGVLAFTRNVEGKQRLVLISLNEQEETVKLPALQGAKSLLRGESPKGDSLTLPAYTFDIFDMA